MVNADIYNLYSILEKRDRMPEEQISRTDFDAQVQRWIAEEYKRLWAEPQAEFDESTIHKIAQAEATERVRAEMERNPAFKEALLFRCAEQWSEERSNEYLQEHRPNGSYRADGILTLTIKAWSKCVTRPAATLCSGPGMKRTRSIFGTSSLGWQSGTTLNTNLWPTWKSTSFRTENRSETPK
jgi:hypothetical protein